MLLNKSSVLGDAAAGKDDDERVDSGKTGDDNDDADGAAAVTLLRNSVQS